MRYSQNGIVQAICGSDIWWKSSIRANLNNLLHVHNAGQSIGYVTQAVIMLLLHDDDDDDDDDDDVYCKHL